MKIRDLANNRSILASVLVSMVVVAIAPLLIMSLQGYHCARQAVLQLTTGQLATVAESKQMRISDWFDERRHEMESLAAFAELHANEDSKCSTLQALFKRAQANNPAYESIALYSKDWIPLADSGRPLRNDASLLPPELKSALSSGSGSTITKPHFHQDGTIGIHIGIPVSNGSQYIIAMLDLGETLYPILASSPGQAGGIHSLLVSDEGLLLSPSGEGIQPSETRVELPEKLTHGSRTAIYSNARGESVVGVAAPLDRLGWMLVSEVPTREAFAWLRVLQKRAMATGLFALFLVVLLSVLSARRISQPLRHMADVAHRISDGNYATRMKHFPGREHAEVADAFNRMLDEIDRSQAQLAQTAALSAIGQLSASIVHEMRNPLSAIQMNLDVLKPAVQGDPVLEELAQIATDQVLRLETMLGDLLDYGKKLEINKAAVPVADFAREIEACIRQEDRRQVEFAFRNDSRADTLSIDHEQMLRAVSNLVDNAVQASPGGGVVTLSLQRSAKNPGKILIEVSDQGEGISKRVAEKLFEPFFTTRKKGTGLGLANVKKIVELHGGRIAFRNNHPGAVFTIALPHEEERP